MSQPVSFLSKIQGNTDVNDRSFGGVEDIELENTEYFHILHNNLSFNLNGIQPTLNKSNNKDFSQRENAIIDASDYFNYSSPDPINETVLDFKKSIVKPRLLGLNGEFENSLTRKEPFDHQLLLDLADYIKCEDLEEKSPSQTVPSMSPFSPKACETVLPSDSNQDRDTYQVPRGKPGRKASGKDERNRKRIPEKGTAEYVEKRCRNNVAVRRSRDKAKKRQQETEGKVVKLSQENETLKKKVEILSKELNILRNLFSDMGVSFPEFAKNIEICA